MTFRSPVRRKTRQRSGFNVAGDTPGSECKLKKSGRLMIKDNYFEITFLKKEVIVQPLFKNEIGILCFGAYIKPKLNLQINMSLEFKIDNHLETISKIMNINAGRWNKIGILAEINITKPKEIDPIECKLKIESQKEDIGIIDFFGINLGAIESSPKDYLKKNKVKDLFLKI